ncbi:hypothetical protein PoMZ_10296 [Pyricularia oryzae]|uniref:Uncharacterized protein n=1 Tax=Pyricularia oryzae TaxID=318829 RepID=A0A4P7MZU4_PYROR|nr:hypothetical protein PoMZ_10296 [Pyricularia oryzae]
MSPIKKARNLSMAFLSRMSTPAANSLTSFSSPPSPSPPRVFSKTCDTHSCVSTTSRASSRQMSRMRTSSFPLTSSSASSAKSAARVTPRSPAHRARTALPSSRPQSSAVMSGRDSVDGPAACTRIPRVRILARDVDELSAAWKRAVRGKKNDADISWAVVFGIARTPAFFWPFCNGELPEPCLCCNRDAKDESLSKSGPVCSSAAFATIGARKPDVIDCAILSMALGGSDLRFEPPAT